MLSYVELAKKVVARHGARTSASPAGDGDAAEVPDLDQLLGMKLLRFAQEGSLLEIRVPWWPVTLFFVPDRRDAEALGARGH